MSRSQTAKIILLVFFLLSLTWSIFTPVFEAPDETTAYEYGRYYSRTWALPVLTKLPLPQGVHHWEPLYFMILGRIAKIIDAPLSDESRYHYSAGWGRIREENPINLYRHEPGEFKFVWDHLAWSLHSMRILSVILATGSVWFLYKAGREIFPKDSWIPVLSMLLYAFNPQFVFFSGILNVVNMVNFSFSLFLWLLMRFLKNTRHSFLSLFQLGVMFGISILSKMTTLATLPVVILVIYWQRINIKKPVVSAMILFLMVFFLAGGWYLVRNQALYGEFTGSRAHVLYRFGKITNPFLEEVGLLNFIISYPKTQWTTLWSGYGWITIYLPAIIPFLLAVVYFHGLWGFVDELKKFKSRINLSPQRVQLLALALIPLVVWLGITRAIFIIEVFHGKDLLFVSGALAIAVIYGLSLFWKKLGHWNQVSMRKKLLAISFLTFLSVFWFEQQSLARFAKGIAGGADITAMATVGMITALIILLAWKLFSHFRVRKITERILLTNPKTTVILLLLLLALIDVSVLFGLVVPPLYNQSLWDLLWQFEEVKLR